MPPLYPSEDLYPGPYLFPSDNQSILTWFKSHERYFETGLDRGVFYPSYGGAVPWNGLISVDETGGESAEEFYMDGRPFLHLPQPKEFTATITAFTYPDAFAEVMGVAEVANGMYVDSQQSDSFGLSYRTLIGDGIDGLAAGYKIHLIYNATVVPQGSSYSSIGSDTSPTNFSWEIKAVPEPISGRRASAHITINTRGLSPESLAALELILYGDVNTLATLPKPQVIMDLLNYGDDIFVTDNEDGTWTVEGSNANVHMTGPGTFEINNVSSIDYGDGTYQISSTV